MPDIGTTKNRRHSHAGRSCVLGAILVCAVFCGSYLLLTLYLSTPSAARHVSKLLTGYLHFPATVTGLRLSGGTFIINGFSLGSPTGFDAGEIVSLRKVSVCPGWRTLLRGSKSLGEIAVEGLSINLQKNRQGEWNYSELVRHLALEKGGDETFIKHLSVTDTTLTAGDIRLDNLSLTVTDFSTKGTTGSKLLLTFKDALGTPFRLEGGGRLGAAPSLEILLSAASFPLNNYREYVKKWPSVDFSGGVGSLSLGLNFHNGAAGMQGKLGMEHVMVDHRREGAPLAVALEFAGRYDSTGDEALLESCSLKLNRAVHLRASGRVRQVRTARDFAAEICLEKSDARELHAMLPPGLRGDLAVAGVIGPARFNVSGTGIHGITAGGGTIPFAGIALERGGKFLVRDLAAVLVFVKAEDGWKLRGTFSQGKGADGEMLQGLEAVITARLSNRMKLLQAGVTHASAWLAGIPVMGEAGFRPGNADPLIMNLTIRKTPVTVLNRHLSGGKTRLTAGMVELALHASGQGPRDFRGNLGGGLSGIRGHSEEGDFVVQEGSLTGDFTIVGGKLAAGGKFSASGTLPNGRGIAISTDIGLRDKEVSLSDGSVTFDRTHLSYASIRGQIPFPARKQAILRLPLRVHLDDSALRSGDASMEGIAADLDLAYVAGQGKRWLEGNGDLTVGKLAYKGRDAGSLAGRLKFAESGVSVQLAGRLLDGNLSGTAEMDPFDRQKKTSFTLTLERTPAAGLASFAPAGQRVKISGGLLGAKLTGGYAIADGIQCRVVVNGRGITLAGNEGKSFLSDGSIQVLSDFARGGLIIRSGSVGLGNGTKLGVRGEVARILTPEREGSISISLPTTSLDTLLPLFGTGGHELSASGTIGAEGIIHLAGGRITLDGEAVLTHAGLDIPAQKVSASDITGSVPVSLVMGGGEYPGKNGKSDLRRGAYDELLASLRLAERSGRTLRIGRLRFGAMDLGDSVLGFRAADGLVELTSLESRFLAGTLLGKGFIRSGGGIRYGAEMALHNLSLRALCNSYPNIKGYISGKVDGIIDIDGGGPGLTGMAGGIDIWTRSTPEEKMLVSKEFLQKLAGKKLKGIFFSNDRPYDHGDIRGHLEKGFLIFDVLDISHTNLFGVRDLSVSVAPVQNKIEIDHLIASIREAATRGKAIGGGAGASPAPVETEFKWQE